MGEVDDGVKIILFNESYPQGSPPFIGLHPNHGGQGFYSTNFAEYVSTGRNRLLIIHVDFCWDSSVLYNLTIEFNDGNLGVCL